MKIVGMEYPAPDPRVTAWDDLDMLLHPAAVLFPALSDEAYGALKHDIEAHGLREPIWVTRKGWLLDGRHRKRACNELGIDCPERVYEGDNPTAFVASLNLHRRHLSTRERAEIAAQIATLSPGRPTTKRGKIAPFQKRHHHRGAQAAPRKVTTIKEAAKLMNVSPRSVRYAKARLHPKATAPKKPTVPTKGAQQVRAKTATKATKPKKDWLAALQANKQVTVGLNEFFAVPEEPRPDFVIMRQEIRRIIADYRVRVPWRHALGFVDILWHIAHDWNIESEDNEISALDWANPNRL